MPHCSSIKAARPEQPYRLTATSSFPVDARETSESGRLLLHNVLTLGFPNSHEDAAIRFAISRPTDCLRASLTFPLLRSRSCCFRPRSLMPLLHFCCARRLFPNVSPYGVPCTTSSLIHPFRGFRYPTACFWSPDRSSSAPMDSTTAFSLGPS
jgi:hypothetical protein